MEEATLFQFRRKIKTAQVLRALVGSRPRQKKVMSTASRSAA